MKFAKIEQLLHKFSINIALAVFVTGFKITELFIVGDLDP